MFKKHSLNIGLALAFIFIPLFAVRLAITVFFIIRAAGNLKTQEREKVSFGLFLLFSFSYLFSPYANAFPTLPLKITSYFILLFIGLFWAHHASGQLKPDFKLTSQGYLAAGVVILYLINFFPLSADIPWRGDEDYHIYTVLDLVRYVSYTFSFCLEGLRNNWLLTFVISFFIVLGSIFLLRKKKINKITLAALAVGVISLAFLFTVLAYPEGFRRVSRAALRYPLALKWSSLVFLAKGVYSDIALYRMIPFLSVILLNFFLFFKFKEITSNKLALGLSLGCVTLPIVYFFSSLNYLEMTIVLLMTVCIFDIKELICVPFKSLKTRPSWYCLLAIAFLKETVFIFILTVAVARFIYQIRRSASTDLWQNILKEIKVMFLIFLPFVVYSAFRINFLSFRRYGLNFNLLLDYQAYLIFVQYLLDQSGALFIFSLLGVIALYRKSRGTFLTALALVVFTLTFFIIDGIIPIGYSRWNLFLLPIMFLGFYHFLAVQPKRYYPWIIVSIFCFNILLSPIDVYGVRTSNWGCPGEDSCEHVYPYSKAIEWVKERGAKNLVFLGAFYKYYGRRFYFEKYGLKFKTRDILFKPAGFGPNEEIRLLYDFFYSLKAISSQDPFEDVPDSFDYRNSIIIYHSLNNLDLDLNADYGGQFRAVKQFVNSAGNRLYLFESYDKRP